MSQPSTQSLRELIAKWNENAKGSSIAWAWRDRAADLEALLPALESALGERQALNETISYQVAYRFKLWAAADALYKWVRGGDIGMYKTQERIMSALKEALYDTEQDAALR